MNNHPMFRKYGRLYNIWQGIVQRCTNPKNKQFYLYGGRGITVCEKWRTFIGFKDDMGPIPEGDVSIERIDNNGGYCKRNCKWATEFEQNRNKRTNRWVTFRGRTMILQDWANELGIERGTIQGRLDAGFPLELVFSKFQLKNPSKPLKPAKTCEVEA